MEQVKKERLVLDTYAVFCFLYNEPGAEEVANLLARAGRQELDLSMSWINLGEVYYIVGREKGLQTAQAITQLVTAWPVTLVEALHEEVLAAADLKARYPLSYADAFAAALARRLHASLVTGDHELEALAAAGEIRLHYLPSRG